MPILAWIVGASLAGGALSVLAAAALALRARQSQVPILISFSVGTLLGAAFLEVLPEAFAQPENVKRVSIAVLGGLLMFFVLEKLLLWKHCHEEACETHAHSQEQADHGRIASMVIIGDGFHNCVDGVIIAGAFLASVELGIITAVAIITHEIPQEVGDFLVLLHSGYSKRKALAFNLLSSGTTLVGGTFAYFALQTMHDFIPLLLGIAAASMLYISVADLIPGLHRRRGARAGAQQALLIAAGVATIWLVGELAHSFANV